MRERDVARLDTRTSNLRIGSVEQVASHARSAFVTAAHEPSPGMSGAKTVADLGSRGAALAVERSDFADWTSEDLAQLIEPSRVAARPSNVLALQRSAGNRAVSKVFSRAAVPSWSGADEGDSKALGTSETMRVVARQTSGARLPSPSAAAAVPAQIKGIQSTFHNQMREADDIIQGTQFHYDYVNGIYRETFTIHQVVLGQANLEALQSERVADAIIAGAALLAKFAPETAAASAIIKIWQFAQKVESIASKAGKVLTIAKAVGGGAKNKDGLGGAPMTPNELTLIGNQNIIAMMTQVADVRGSADAMLDAAIDVSTQIGMDAPDSGQLTAGQSVALTDTVAACEQLLAAIEPVLAALRALRDRRKVPVPSWIEFEQDIWIAYFNQVGRIGTGEALRSHMRDIGLFGRLGILEEHSMGMVWENADVPAKEDEATQQSVPAKTISGMEAVNAAAARLPVKYRRLMLLQN
jgi:hypothetical protein